MPDLGPIETSCIAYDDGLHCDHWFADDGHCCQCQADNTGDEQRDDGEIPSVAWCAGTCSGRARLEQSISSSELSRDV